MEKENRINICYVVDDNYAIHAMVSMYSIISNADNNDYFSFYIFDNAISQKNKKKFLKFISKKVNVNLISVTSHMKKLEKFEQTATHITKTSYCKFLIADLLPKIDKILYLDCDLVVVDKISDLFSSNIDDYLFAAVEDVGYTYWSKFRDNMKLKFLCINSGVMLINCKKWREENLLDQLLYRAQNREPLGYGQDQPVFNYVCKDKILFLDLRYNAQDVFFRDGIELKNRKDFNMCVEVSKFPTIIHFTSSKKPWDFCKMPKADIYWKYRNLIDKKINKINYLFSLHKMHNYIEFKIFKIKIKFKRRNK